MYNMIVFDMDGTLLNGRTIFRIAEKKGFLDQLQKVINDSIEPYQKSIKIATFLKGLKKSEIMSIFRGIPFRPHVVEMVKLLREHGFIMAVATDSYDIVANDVKKRLRFHHSFANTLLFHDDICTGDIKLHNINHIKDEVTQQIYSICKSCVVDTLSKNYNMPYNKIIAVGDGTVDCSMLQKAGLGIAAFASDYVNSHADIITSDLQILKNYI
jgi:HAD superfamily phosphoserine phosphatase-like hydrolase